MIISSPSSQIAVKTHLTASLTPTVTTISSSAPEITITAASAPNTTPVVSILSPANGSSVNEGTIAFRGAASDASARATRRSTCRCSAVACARSETDSASRADSRARS
ncbi:Ig-like domain-containing protein [Rheinheimera sp.]|uniref:Ig-like domain-containing protein n=1 Tax=Rheinheimera sp. TaxID=1869214 RepID=UPI003AF73F51